MPDDYTITVPQANGPDVTITGAPSPVNRYDRGITVLMTRIRVDRKPCVVTWAELRSAAAKIGLFIDPRDDQPEAPGLRERYENPVARMVREQAGLPGDDR